MIVFEKRKKRRGRKTIEGKIIQRNLKKELTRKLDSASTLMIVCAKRKK